MFDFKDFYPSISKKIELMPYLFIEAVIKLDDHDKKIIYQSRKSLLFNQEQTWMERRRRPVR